MKYAIPERTPLTKNVIAGRRYEVTATRNAGKQFWIKDENGQRCFCLAKGCAYGGNWRFEDTGADGLPILT